MQDFFLMERVLFCFEASEKRNSSSTKQLNLSNELKQRYSYLGFLHVTLAVTLTVYPLFFKAQQQQK